MKHPADATPAARGSSWTRAAQATTRGSSWTRDAQAPTRGSSWTRDARTSTRGSSWTRTAAKLTAILAATGAALVPTAATALAAPGHGIVVAAPELHVIRAESGQLAQVETAITAAGGTITRRMDALQTVTALITPEAARQLRTNASVASLVPNRNVKLQAESYEPGTDANSLYNVRQQTGITQAWRTATGSGVDVALIDSGVSPVQGLDSSRVINGPDLSFESNNTDLRYLDTFGHGTHMAGIILGRDSGAALDATDKTSFV
ncbi:MAG: S8 family serine peptidase, partial [Mycobacteriales bacterium]